MSAKRTSTSKRYPRDWYEVSKAENGFWEVLNCSRIPGVDIIRLPAPGIGPRYFETEAQARLHMASISK